MFKVFQKASVFYSDRGWSKLIRNRGLIGSREWFPISNQELWTWQTNFSSPRFVWIDRKKLGGGLSILHRACLKCSALKGDWMPLLVATAWGWLGPVTWTRCFTLRKILFQLLEALSSRLEASLGFIATYVTNSMLVLYAMFPPPEMYCTTLKRSTWRGYWI